VRVRSRWSNIGNVARAAAAGDYRDQRMGQVEDSGRRASQRYPLHADVEVLDPLHAHGVVINASDGGLRIAVDTALPLGAVCVLEVKSAEGATVELARVAWLRELRDGFLVGMSFVREG
jgi:hypothetical protein